MRREILLEKEVKGIPDPEQEFFQDVTHKRRFEEWEIFQGPGAGDVKQRELILKE